MAPKVILLSLIVLMHLKMNDWPDKSPTATRVWDTVPSIAS